MPALPPGDVIGEVLGKGGGVGVNVSAAAVEELIDNVAGLGEVDANLEEMAAPGDGEVIGELKAVFGGLDAGQIVWGPEIGDAVDGEGASEAGVGQSAGDQVVGLTILEPAEAEFVDYGVGHD